MASSLFRRTRTFLFAAVALVGTLFFHGITWAQVDYGPTLSSSVSPDNIVGSLTTYIYPALLPIIGIGAAIWTVFFIFRRANHAMK